MELSVIVPAASAAPHVGELVRRIGSACRGIDAEVVLVDDSPDGLPEAACRSAVPVHLIRRGLPAGGLGGAVIEGVRSSAGEHCLVMDGGLQHPPEMIPEMLERLRDPAADVVVASRSCGSAGGPARGVRGRVPTGSTAHSRRLFPVRLKDCTDPTTGFFGFRRSVVDPDRLKPSGSTILFEILVRHSLRVAEVPIVVGERPAGEPQTGAREAFRILRRLCGLRFGRIAGFGLVGGIGAVLNLLIMATLMFFGVHYVVAAVVAAETTILTNFVMQERLVFHAERAGAHPVRRRFLQSFGFNNLDAAARLPVLWLLVEFAGIGSLAAQAGTLVAAFLLRYLYHSRVVYRAAPAVPAHSPAPAPVHHPAPTPVPAPARFLRRRPAPLTAVAE